MGKKTNPHLETTRHTRLTCVYLGSLRMIAVECLRLLCETFGTLCRNRCYVHTVYALCTFKWQSLHTVFLNTRGGTKRDCGFGRVSVAQKPVYHLNVKRWQLEGLAWACRWLECKWSRGTTCVGETCLRALLLLHTNVCGRFVLSRVVLTGELDDLYNKATARVLVKHTRQPVWLL